MEEKWSIQFYESESGNIPAEDFIKSLSTEIRARTIRDLERLEKFGVYLPQPYAKAIKGEKYKGLYELRTKVGNNISRLFFFFIGTEL